MPDADIHYDILKILCDGCGGSESLLDRVRRLFHRFLHVFFGLKSRDMDEILSSVSASPFLNTRTHASLSPSVDGGSPQKGGMHI